MKPLNRLFLFIVLTFCLNGCALFKLPGQTIQTAGTVTEAVGKTMGTIVEVTGKTIVAGSDAVGRVAEAGGKVAEAVIKTPGAKEAVVDKLIP